MKAELGKTFPIFINLPKSVQPLSSVLKAPFRKAELKLVLPEEQPGRE